MSSTLLALAVVSLALAPARAPLVQGSPAQQKTAQQLDMDGLWEGYDGEWHHLSYELLALAEAIPEKDYAWRPGPGVRSTSETIMHIVITNYWLLSFTGHPIPPGPPLKGTAEKTVTSRADVIAWLQRSLEAVRQARLNETPGDLAKHVNIEGRSVTVDDIYLRIIVHANEHLGQLIAYARINNVVPPWSRK